MAEKVLQHIFSRVPDLNSKERRITMSSTSVTALVLGGALAIFLVIALAN